MTKDLTKQEPCPFCGSHELIAWQDENPLNRGHYIECQNCITLFKFPDHVQSSALELWNDRGNDVERASSVESICSTSPGESSFVSGKGKG